MFMRNVHFEAIRRKMWEFLDHLREVKNAIFFSSVTERALEAYE